MHWRAHGATMQQFTEYADGVVETVRAELAARLEAALAAGIPAERLVADPGLGFSKTAEQNWALLRGLDRIADLGRPVLVGASRKAFLGRLLAGPGGSPRPVGERESANTAITILLAQAGVWCARVHDVRAARDALAVYEQMTERNSQ
jgi:dihydropteroate synthase